MGAERAQTDTISQLCVTLLGTVAIRRSRLSGSLRSAAMTGVGGEGGAGVLRREAAPAQSARTGAAKDEGEAGSSRGVFEGFFLHCNFFCIFCNFWEGKKIKKEDWMRPAV